MVHIHDEGSEFDAPLDAIWKYLEDPAHGLAHKDRRNGERKLLGENTLELSFEQEIDGRWTKGRNRITLFPPLGYAVELLEGPFAGSKAFTIFTPQGKKTRVTVTGEYVSSTVPRASRGECPAFSPEDLRRGQR
ncbi:hypothetical protein B2A_03642, partial [mine drainage metagenome]